ncbi:MAG: hypothetical protein M3552_18100 [Planctomycetota bacterium]|nr:hypothetical protein [Planctomycetota bacterium]
MVSQTRSNRHEGLLDDDQVALLRDTQAFIEFGIRNNLNFLTIMAALGHDLNGLHRYGFDLEAAKRDAFTPKVSGYSEVSANDVGQGTDDDV